MSSIINASAANGLQQTSDGSGVLVLQGNGVTGLTVDSTGAYGQLKQGTAQASASGAAIDFTGIPAWAKRITVIFSGVSLSAAADDFLVQLGTAGGFVTAGYASGSGYGTTYTTSTTGMVMAGLSASSSNLLHGTMVLNLFSGTSWVSSHSAAQTGTTRYLAGGGSVDIGGALTQIRITRSATATFDAGSINILYEG